MLIAQLAALPLFLVAFKWLLAQFEADNSRNTWGMAATVVALSVASSGLVLALLLKRSPQLELAILVVACLGVSVVAGTAAMHWLMRVPWRRALGLSLALPVGWGWSLQAVTVSAWTVEGMLAFNPTLTLLLACASAALLIALHRHRTRFARELFQLTSWLG